MTTERGRFKPIIPVTRRLMMVGAYLIGIAALVISMSGLLGAARAMQILVTLILPATVMLAYWQIARKRLFARERELETEIGLERVAHRATTEFLVGVAHELRQHPLRCSLRAEALAVAVEYRDLGPAMKVAVPDVVIVIDPYLLRQALHVLVGNAVRHGGSRVAIWATVEEGTVHLNVSDDGPALPSDIAAHAFQRYLDLAEPNHASDSRDVGLPLARILSELMGGEITHKRDPNWTHFSIRLSLAANELASPHDVVPLRAGVH